MRILMLIPQAFYSTRGTPLSAYHRTRELTEQGQEVDVLTYKVGGPPPGELAATVYRARGPHFFSDVPPGPSLRKIWFDFLLFLNLVTRLVVKRYDLVYAHEEGAFMARMCRVVFRVPYVYDMHSSLPLQITDWGFSRRRWVIRLFGWVERFSVRGARAIVAISPAVADAARKVCPNARVVVIVNHFATLAANDLDASAIRQRYGLLPDRRIVLYTGSFVALQALDLLVDAVPEVVRQAPEVMFLLVGGSEAEMEPLRAQAARLGVADNIVFDRNRPQSEMAAYMAAAEVLVSPRVRGINPPGKLFSYLESGRPVVATNTLVHNQLLDTQNAVLTAPTAQGLADGIVRALNDGQLRASVIAGARGFLDRHCSNQARQDAYRQLLEYAGDLRPGWRVTDGAATSAGGGPK